jgi:hypothetical protein
VETFVVRIVEDDDVRYVLSVARNGQVFSSTRNRSKAAGLTSEQVDAIANYKQRNYVRLRRVSFTIV